MQKSIISILLITLLLVSSVAAQKGKAAVKKPTGKRTTTPPKSTTGVATTNTPRVIGANITITTKDGNNISGSLVDLTAYSVRIKSGGLESTLALETIAAISFDSTLPAQAPPLPPLSEMFSKSLTAAFNAFQTMASVQTTPITANNSPNCGAMWKLLFNDIALPRTQRRRKSYRFYPGRSLITPGRERFGH
jgi:hypothetical protein